MARVSVPVCLSLCLFSLCARALSLSLARSLALSTWQAGLMTGKNEVSMDGNDFVKLSDAIDVCVCVVCVCLCGKTCRIGLQNLQNRSIEDKCAQ